MTIWGVPPALTLVGLVGVMSLVACGTPREQPVSLSPDYQETVRAFHQGLASLDVGLLEDAEILFARAAALSPDEPAIRANLALVRVGFGDDVAAEVELEMARSLAPDNSELAFLGGQLASFSARFEEAEVLFRETLVLDPGHRLGRFALAQQLERSDEAARWEEAQQLFASLLVDLPDNLAVLVEHLRVAARREDRAATTATLERLIALGERWPPVAVTQLQAVSGAVEAGDFAQAATRAQLVRNVLVRLAEFRKDQTAVSVSAELIAGPLRRFLRLPLPVATAAPRDTTLSYRRQPLGGTASGRDVAVAVVPPNEDGTTAIVAVDTEQVRWLSDDEQPPLSFPVVPGTTPPAGNGLVAMDWNGDFRMDLALAGAGGVRLVVQSEDGQFVEMTPTVTDDAAFTDVSSHGVWAADTEMDGDLDLVLAPVSGVPWVLRNNADGTWLPTQPFPEVDATRGFGWGDLDRDGDPDPVLLDANGVVHPVENLQAGQFRRWPVVEARNPVLALTLADINADGQIDLVTLGAGGAVRRHSWTDGGWSEETVARWSSADLPATPGGSRLVVADLDNNGALDLLASGGGATRVWLSDQRSRFEVLDTPISVEVFGVGDLNADGWLDLVGIDQGNPVQLLGEGTAGYAWQQIRPRAHTAAGDQRINAFGVGGEIEVRAGLMVQKQVLTGAPVHVGLGEHAQSDLTRIYWPNGVMQADFDFVANQVITAEQRLKGSCPWLFAYDGHAMRFVTDFLWRSPLGLRINAQETADVPQTEDWVLIRGDQLAPRDGTYDLRVTAELWETHFIDHVSLLVIDHPPGTETYVDERFAPEPRKLRPYITGMSRSVVGAWDDAGTDVTDLVRARDQRYVASFERGSHQGVTRDHYMEVELAPFAEGDVWLLAHGWVYPTDSSINVALGQGQHDPPRGVALEALTADGHWVVLHPDLGFPAGKSKTMVIDVPRLPGGTVPRRLRLRTNLEVYWDWVGSAARLDAERPQLQRLVPEIATLEYRGYSTTALIGPRGLEIPRYEIANVRPRWRDLVGYHTRFGDVRELIEEVDDRYIIMNAGDELRFKFLAPDPAPQGWQRDFALIGDGWVKDGDFNTTHSKTVGPLPTHERSTYPVEASSTLEDDPVYRRHRKDWDSYHTRFVAPDRFLRGLGETR